MSNKITIDDLLIIIIVFFFFFETYSIIIIIFEILKKIHYKKDPFPWENISSPEIIN
jgi:hypothetical protein